MSTTAPLLPCNDPRRNEWGIFSDLLGRDIGPPHDAAPEVAATLMKTTLFEAFARDPGGFVVKMLHRRGESGSAFSTLQREAATYPGGWPAMRDEIADRLVAPMDGKERLITDESRGSSYDALAYWQPAQGGLVTYMRHRIQWTVQAMRREQVTFAQTLVSLEALQSVGIDISEDGRVIRHMDELRHWPEGGAGDAVSLMGRLPPGASAGVGRFRREYALFGGVLGCAVDPADSPAARVGQLRELAVTAFRVERGGIGDPEMERRIVAWDPAAASFRHTFPSLTATYEKYVESRTEYLPRQEAVPVPPAELEAVERLSGEADGGGKLVRLARAARRFWSAKAVNDADLSNPQRPDYEYLALVTGHEVETDPPSVRLFGSIRAMAQEWADVAVRLAEGRLAGRVTALKRAVVSYDPAKDGYLGEYLRDPEVWKDPARPCPLPEAHVVQHELFFGEPSPISWAEPTTN
jgi:hypothetical protein